MTRQQVSVVRCIIVALIICAIAGITFHRYTNQLTTIFVVDVSDSISLQQRQASLHFIRDSMARQGSRDRVGLVEFAREPYVKFPPASTLDTSQVGIDVPGDATDIQTGLAAAAGAMPPDSAKRIVLFTDGQENRGSAMSAAAALKDQGVQVDIAPTDLTSERSPEALVERVVAPAQASVNAPISLRVVLSSNVAQNAKLVLSRDGTPIAQSNMQLESGKTAFYFTDRLETSGIHTYTATLTPTVDTNQQNNSASSLVDVHGAPRVLLLRNSGEKLSSALPAALAVQGIGVTQMSPSSAPPTVAALAGYDSIILSDVAAGDLSTSEMTNIKSANQDFGVGLGMIGGVNSFGAGGYAGSPLEDALPVKMTPKDRRRVPAADVVIVLDASGSMAAEEDGVEKVQIAARAALNLLKALQPTDRVAVLAVTETPTLVMPLVPQAQSSHYIPAIESVEAGGGGIDCRNGLEAAYLLLQTSDAQIKHVIICPDTTDSEQQEGCVNLATTVYNAAKISTSVCGIGQWSDSDVPFQRSLAKAGHGQLFVANQASTLPQFFQRDVQNVEQKLIEEGTFNVLSTPGDPVAEVDSGVPQILGYNLVDPKSNATVPMTIQGHKDALLAYWRDGVGKSFAFTSDDDSHWSTHWTAWSQYPSFWAHVVRWSLKGGSDDQFQTLVSNIKGHAHIVVDAFGASGYATGSRFDADVAGPDGSVKHVPLDETSPGRYESTFSTTALGSYSVQVRNADTGGSQTMSVTTSYSPEYAELSPDTQLLGQLSSETGGIFLRKPGQAFRPGLTLSLGSDSLVSPFLFIACLLFVLDVAWRRFGWRLHRRGAEQTAVVLRDSAVVVAGSIKTAVTGLPDIKQSAQYRADAKLTEDPDFLRRRTAARSDLEDDDPFPFVASLPPPSRITKSGRHRPSEEDK
jgi:Mg-chelatase subunit ChlD